MLTKERKEKLLTAKKMADTISETLTPILNGTCTQAEAARKLGITPQKFNNYIKTTYVSPSFKSNIFRTFFILNYKLNPTKLQQKNRADISSVFLFNTFHTHSHM